MRSQKDGRLQPSKRGTSHRRKGHGKLLGQEPQCVRPAGITEGIDKVTQCCKMCGVKWSRCTHCEGITARSNR